MSDPQPHDPLNNPFRNRTSAEPHEPAAPDPLSSTPLSRDEGSFSWGWIAAAAIVLLIAAMMMGGETNKSQMANEGSGTVPGVTRSTQIPESAPSSAPLSAPSAAPAPSADQRSPAFAPAETTGSGSTNSSSQ